MEFIQMTHKIIKPNGKLIALLFHIDKDLNDDGQPYGIDLDSTISNLDIFFYGNLDVCF